VAGSGINGLSVGVVTIGGLLVYAGIRGVTPLQALRDVSSGTPVPIPDQAGPLMDLSTSVSAPGVTVGNVASSGQQSTDVVTSIGKISNTGSTLVSVSAHAVAAVSAYTGDKYSQSRREQSGYSDCSSFVAKGFHAVGVAKPDGRMAWPNTSAFAIGPAWKTIPQSQARPGDIAVVSGHHMVFVTNVGGTQGIGQQNSHTNVKTGSIATLFASVPGKPVFRTYVGSG
jgi:hypothetical protein